MRSKTAKARKDWQRANSRRPRYWLSSHELEPENATFSIPPRYQLLQKIAKHYTCEVKRGESPVSFDITVDPRRILRAGNSRHFTSCLDFKEGASRLYIKGYLQNRYCAVAGTLNSKTGEWLSRVFVHVCLNTDVTPNKEVLVMEEIYGNNFPLREFVQTMFVEHGLEVYQTTQANLPDEYNWYEESPSYYLKFLERDEIYLRTLSRHPGYYFTPTLVYDYSENSWRPGKRLLKKEGYHVQARRMTFIQIEKN